MAGRGRGLDELSVRVGIDSDAARAFSEGFGEPGRRAAGIEVRAEVQKLGFGDSRFLGEFTGTAAVASVIDAAQRAPPMRGRIAARARRTRSSPSSIAQPRASPAKPPTFVR